MVCLTDGTVNMQIPILFCRHDSLYKSLPFADVWDEQRNALQYVGSMPVVAHPPCRTWGRLRQFAKAPPGEWFCAIFAVCVIRSNGGVLEHPAESTLWQAMGLPKPGAGRDKWGGFTIEIRQCDFGHVAEKLTWLYIVTKATTLPVMPARREPTHVVKSSKRDDPKTRLPICTHKWRDQTPVPLALWLIEVATHAA